MKRGAAAEVDLIKFMTEVRKGANSKKLDAHAKVFAHDLKQQQLAVLQSIDPNGENFEDECRKAKPLADRLTDMVATDILASSSKKEMVHVIEFYLKVAHESLKAGDYQSALFLSTAVNGMDISRLGISDDISKQAKAQLAEIRGVIDNNQRFKQFNQFLKTQNGPNIVPITSSIQAQYVGLKEKKTLADTDDVKESLQTGINETKGILRNYVQSAHPEPMQSNLMAKLAAPTIPYDAAYSSGEKDQPEPLSIEGRSRILKKAGANQTINPNTPEAKASTAAVTQYLKTQPASPLPQLPPTAQKPAPLSPQPVAASSSSDKGKEEKAEGPLLEPIAQAAPQARSKYEVGGKVDAKGRKRYKIDGGPDPEASQRPAASSNDKGKEEEKAQVAAMEPVEVAAPVADAKAKDQHDLSFMDITPKKATTKAAKEVAQGLMNIGIEMAAKIPASEVVNNQWETPNSIIDKAVKYSVGITERVRDSVLLAGSKEEQIKTFRFMLDVMNQSLKAGDVNTAMAIYQGLDNTPVNRLKYLSENKTIARDFAKAEAFFSPDKNCKNIRDYTNALAQSGKPVVPSIALFTKDLTFARDGNRTDFKLNEEGEKQLSTIFENFKRSEMANANSANKASNNPPVMEQWLNAPRLSEAEADAHSALIKPRGIEVPNFDQVPTRAQVFAAKAAAQQQAPVAQPPVAGPSAAQAPQMPVASSSSSANSEPEIDYENDPNYKGKEPADDHKNAATTAAQQPIATHAVQAPQPVASSSNSAATSPPQAKAVKKEARPVTPEEMAAYTELKSQAANIRARIDLNQGRYPTPDMYQGSTMYINRDWDLALWHKNQDSLADQLTKLTVKMNSMEDNNPGLKDAYAAAQAAKQPTAPSVQEDKGKKPATDNISEELKAAEPDKVKKARKIRIPKRVEGKPTGPAPVPPSGSNEPVAQQLANEAPKTPKRKTVRFADDAKPQEPAPTRPPRDRAAQLIKLKALSNAYKASSSAYQEYKESKNAEQSQIAPQPAVPTQPTAASVDAGLNPIINDAKQTDAKNKAQDLLNGLSKVNAPQVKLSDAGKVEFTVSGNRNSKALQKSLEKAGIECQVKKGKGGTTFSFDADKLNALSNQDVKNLVKATRAEFKELTKELKEKRRTAVIPEEQKAEKANQIAASLREKAPPPALPVVKVDPVAASPVDAAAQLANMLNNPMPSNNITAPPLETTAPQPQGFGKPGRRAGLGQAAALGNDEVKADAKPPMTSNFDTVKNFWKAQDSKAIQAAKEEKGATADAGRKPIKPT